MKAGTIIRGNLRVLAKIGQGGMGAVYVVKNLDLDKLQAVKVMLPKPAKDEKRVREFKAERRNQASFGWDGVVTIIDGGKENGLEYMVMDYIPHGSIYDYVKTEGKLSMNVGLKLTLGTAFSLKMLHKEGLVHRDIKPSNIMLRERGWVALTDFGLAVSMLNLPSTQLITGTPAYMSPEQWLGKPIDNRTDIYSLGASLYYMLTRDTPFGGKFNEIMTAHTDKVVPDIQEQNPEITDQVSDLIKRCMAHESEDRFKDPKEVTKAIYNIWENDSNLSYEKGKEEVIRYIKKRKAQGSYLDAGAPTIIIQN